MKRPITRQQTRDDIWMRPFTAVPVERERRQLRRWLLLLAALGMIALAEVGAAVWLLFGIGNGAIR